MRDLVLFVVSSLLFVACAGPVWEAVEAEGEAPDWPNAALQWRAERQQDENGTIPPQAWQSALQGRAALVAAASLQDDGGISPLGWVERGPFNVAGRSRTLAIDPRDTRILWSGGVSGGLWKSLDRGATWGTVSDWWTNLAIASLTLSIASRPVVASPTTSQPACTSRIARKPERTTS